MSTRGQQAAGGWQGEQMDVAASLTHTSAKATESNVSSAASKAGRWQVNVREAKHPGLSKAVGGVDGMKHFCLRIEKAKELLHKLFSVLKEE